MPRKHNKHARGKHKFSLNKGVVVRTGVKSSGWYRSDDIDYPERNTANVIDSKGRV